MKITPWLALEPSTLTSMCHANARMHRFSDAYLRKYNGLYRSLTYPSVDAGSERGTSLPRSGQFTRSCKGSSSSVPCRTGMVPVAPAKTRGNGLKFTIPVQPVHTPSSHRPSLLLENGPVCVAKLVGTGNAAVRMPKALQDRCWPTMRGHGVYV
jgi:hypothetical protein